MVQKQASIACSKTIQQYVTKVTCVSYFSQAAGYEQSSGTNSDNFQLEHNYATDTCFYLIASYLFNINFIYPFSFRMDKYRLF